jgi:hypothetical protein
MSGIALMGQQTSESLLARAKRICDTTNAMKCIHDERARTISRQNRVLSITLIVANAGAAFILASGLREMIPRAVGVVAAVLSALAAVCTGFAFSFDYRGKAARHSELATCYAALTLSCEADRERFREGRLEEDQFDTILGCNVQIMKELQLRSHGLDSTCAVPPPG